MNLSKDGFTVVAINLISLSYKKFLSRSINIGFNYLNMRARKDDTYLCVYKLLIMKVREARLSLVVGPEPKRR